jgi:predicted alpha/beta-hydrolase family hydrolase
MAKLAFLFAPGAGAPSTHPWMHRWSKLLGAVGRVELMDYPYALAHRGRPDPLLKLIDAHKAALAAIRAKHRGEIVLIGKSMGGRVGCHVALTEKVHAVVCLGYPLCGGGDVTKLRDQVLIESNKPILFVQGTRDSLCPLPLLESVRKKMTAPNDLIVVEGGDHSLEVTKRQLRASGETQEVEEKRLVALIARFVQRPE